MPTEYEIDVIPLLIVLVISLAVIGFIKLIVLILDWDHKRYTKEYEDIMSKFKDNE